MALNTLHDVYHDQLQDLWSANTQSLEIVGELGRAASDKALSEALISGANGISEGIEAIAEICNTHDIKPNGEHCKGMEGLVAEAKAHVLNAEFGDPAVRDAMIITQYQRMVHYALAGYGCLLAFANRLELDGDGAKLQQCLDNTFDGDRTMTDIAMNGGVNAEAA
ncbi:ferritin-like domain-containing protein [Yoonia sp. 208BN28-4]|uniref:ferritin-like domain-containing protein n=1 Tax=Yoonia sp. 208BN28-4 TaxID=3126505 RepID=UPI0030ADC689